MPSIHGIVHWLSITLFQFGGVGLLILGILDSSILFMPLANDLLVVAMTAKRHLLLPYFAAMATAGSVLGCCITDFLARKGGEEGLEKHVPRGRLEYVKRRVKENAAYALAFAAVMPPPFPFTPFVAGAAALQYPRKKLLSVVAAARFFRFSMEGVLAIFFGTRILQLAQSRAVEYVIIALMVIAIGGSAFSIYSWVKRSRSVGRRQAGGLTA
jgi:membrane protein YqaA with SNARE-associated domain